MNDLSKINWLYVFGRIPKKDSVSIDASVWMLKEIKRNWKVFHKYIIENVDTKSAFMRTIFPEVDFNNTEKTVRCFDNVKILTECDNNNNGRILKNEFKKKNSPFLKLIMGLNTRDIDRVSGQIGVLENKKDSVRLLISILDIATTDNIEEFVEYLVCKLDIDEAYYLCKLLQPFEDDWDILYAKSALHLYNNSIINTENDVFDETAYDDVHEYMTNNTNLLRLANDNGFDTKTALRRCCMAEVDFTSTCVKIINPNTVEAVHIGDKPACCMVTGDVGEYALIDSLYFKEKFMVVVYSKSSGDPMASALCVLDEDTNIVLVDSVETYADIKHMGNTIMSFLTINGFEVIMARQYVDPDYCIDNITTIHKENQYRTIHEEFAIEFNTEWCCVTFKGYYLDSYSDSGRYYHITQRG